MQCLQFDMPLPLDRQAERFCLPLQGTFIQWNGRNPVFGDLFILVDNAGMRLQPEDLGTALERIGPSRFQIHHTSPLPPLEITVFEKEDHAFLVMRVGNQGTSL